MRIQLKGSLNCQLSQGIERLRVLPGKYLQFLAVFDVHVVFFRGIGDDEKMIELMIAIFVPAVTYLPLAGGTAQQDRALAFARAYHAAIAQVREEREVGDNASVGAVGQIEDSR